MLLLHHDQHLRLIKIFFFKLPLRRSHLSRFKKSLLLTETETLLQDYPPESYDIKCMEDAWEYLKTENAVPKFESYIRGWMKQIQELLLESEQLRLETDDAGPQVYYSLNRCCCR